MEAGINESWAASKIRYYNEDENKLDHVQYNAATVGEEFFGAEYTTIAEKLFDGSLGMIDVSPTTLDYLASQYAPGLISDISKFC